MRRELIIQNVFMHSFSRYINGGYKKVRIDIDFDGIDGLDSIIIEAKNADVYRDLNFRYQAYNGPGKDFITEFVWFSIVKGNSRLDLSDYWRQIKGEDFRIISLINQVEGNSFEMRLENYFERIIRTLDNELKLVVEGKEWLEVPFNWYPYK